MSLLQHSTAILSRVIWKTKTKNWKTKRLWKWVRRRREREREITVLQRTIDGFYEHKLWWWFMKGWSHEMVMGSWERCLKAPTFHAKLISLKTKTNTNTHNILSLSLSPSLKRAQKEGRKEQPTHCQCTQNRIPHKHHSGAHQFIPHPLISSSLCIYIYKDRFFLLLLHPHYLFLGIFHFASQRYREAEEEGERETSNWRRWRQKGSYCLIFGGQQRSPSMILFGWWWLSMTHLITLAYCWGSWSKPPPPTLKLSLSPAFVIIVVIFFIRRKICWWVWLQPADSSFFVSLGWRDHSRSHSYEEIFYCELFDHSSSVSVFGFFFQFLFSMLRS